MESIIVCNTAGDSISKVSLMDYTVTHLPLDLGQKPVGPHGVDVYKGKIITANNYSDSISIIDIALGKEISNLYVGSHPNDVKILEDYAYVVCGESNSLCIVDLINFKIVVEIALDEMPHNICIDKCGQKAYVSSMNDSIVSIIDCKEGRIIKRVKAPEYPTKILQSNDKKVIYVCESYLGHDVDGYISILTSETLNTVQRIKVGVTPVDMWEDNGKLYVSNFAEGSISIVDVSKAREVKKIYIGGMPRGIVKYMENIIIGDYYRGILKVLNLKLGQVKNIAVGKEPNAILPI